MSYEKYKTVAKIFSRVIPTILILTTLFLGAWILSACWNAIIPLVFAGVNTITYWQAMGLMVIVDTLFSLPTLTHTISTLNKEQSENDLLSDAILNSMENLSPEEQQEFLKKMIDDAYKMIDDAYEDNDRDDSK